jgi:hypothetical protein
VRICRKPPNRWGKYTYTNIHLTFIKTFLLFFGVFGNRVTIIFSTGNKSLSLSDISHGECDQKELGNG